MPYIYFSYIEITLHKISEYINRIDREDGVSFESNDKIYGEHSLSGG